MYCLVFFLATLIAFNKVDARDSVIFHYEFGIVDVEITKGCNKIYQDQSITKPPRAAHGACLNFFGDELCQKGLDSQEYYYSFFEEVKSFAKCGEKFPPPRPPALPPSPPPPPPPKNAIEFGKAGMTSRYYDAEGICGCIKVDSNWIINYNQNKSFINNTECILLYDDNNCTNLAMQLPATQTINDIKTPPKSFQLCQARSACIFLSITLFKIMLIPPAEPLDMYTELEIVDKHLLHNNGSTIISKLYSTKSTFEEIIRVQLIDSVKSVDKNRVCYSGEKCNSRKLIRKAEKSTVFKNHVLSVLEDEILNLYAEKFAINATGFNSKLRIVSKSNRKEILTSETIDVPPCTILELQNSLTVVKSLPIVYIANATISAIYLHNSEPVNATLLYNLVPKNLANTTEIANFSLEASGAETAYVTYLLGSSLSASTRHIPGCCTRINSKCV